MVLDDLIPQVAVACSGSGAFLPLNLSSSWPFPVRLMEIDSNSGRHSLGSLYLIWTLAVLVRVVNKSVAVIFHLPADSFHAIGIFNSARPS